MPCSADYDPQTAQSYEGANPSIWPIIPTDVSHVLDVGCGRGANAAWLSQRGAIVDGVSWNADELLIARSVCRKVYHCDLNDGIFGLQPESYDCVLCSHTLEHIAYPNKMLTDIERSMAHGGYLIVAVPNLFFWRDRLKLLQGNWDYQDSGTFDYTHLRWYTQRSMSSLLDSYGFSLDAFLADGWLPVPGLKYLLGARLRSKVNATVCKWWPSLFGNQFVFRFRKP